jgi:hypothetical protein
MSPRLDDIRPGACPILLERLCRHMVEDSETRKGRTMATLGSSSRTVLRSNLSQGTLTTS